MTPASERAKRIILSDPDRLEPAIAQEILAAIGELLNELGRRGFCPVCMAVVYWIRHQQSTRMMPRDLDGADHMDTCLDVRQLRKHMKAPA